MSEAPQVIHHENVAEIALKKAPVFAIGLAVVFVSVVWGGAYFLKETRLNEPLIDLMKAHTNASTDLTREVKENTAAVKENTAEIKSLKQDVDRRFAKQDETNKFIQEQFTRLNDVANISLGKANDALTRVRELERKIQ